MAGLARWKPFGQIFPPSATSKDAEDDVDDFAAVPPRSIAPVFPARRTWGERDDDGPLFVSQFFSLRHRFSLARPFMRRLLVFTIRSLIFVFTINNSSVHER
jgi:hypothetical protein